MITKLDIENFRGFERLSISPLKRINLFAGANNTGKTAVLEALVLLFGNDQGPHPIQTLPGLFRSNLAGASVQSNQDDYATFWECLFFDRQTALEPRITALRGAAEELVCRLKSQEDGIEILQEWTPASQVAAWQPGPAAADKRVYSLRVSSPGPQPQPPPYTWRVNKTGRVGASGRPSSTAQELTIVSTRQEHPAQDADVYNEVTLLEGGEERLTALLRQVDSRLQKLRYAKAPGMSQPLVYAHFGMRNAISMTQAGQGFSKLFSLFCHMILSKAKILFIDEIENGLYYEALPEIWKGIATLAASENIQVFATTHSRECILAAHQTMTAVPEYDFALHRLQRVKGQIEAVTHDRGMLDAAIKSGLEVR